MTQKFGRRVGTDNSGCVCVFTLLVCYVDLGGGETYPLHHNGFINNTCIQGQDMSSYVGINCNNNQSWPALRGNQIYNPSGITSVCGMTLAQRQAHGYDIGSAVHKGIPSDTSILALAENVLAAP